MRAEDRERAVVELTARMAAEAESAAQSGQGPSLEELLGDALYLERRRLEGNPYPKTRRQDRAFWERIRKELLHASEDDLREMVRRVVEHHAREIVGRFDPRVYALATRAVPLGLSVLLNALSPKALLRELPGLPDATQSVVLEGEVEAARRIQDKGTVILVPTHSSNLDSIIIGWSLYRAGLPPFTYGAGINLFTNPMISFFMHNLGAYKVDRMKRHQLYLDTLKQYCNLSIEYGYDNLFFPGGTRSRSGGVEQKLKLGLLGCGLKAYLNNLKAGKSGGKIFVVPCTLNYHLVLEGETLIEDHLKEVGKSRYIIVDDEFSKPRRVAAFMAGLVGLDSRIYVRFSRPLDPFGNLVDEDGISRDQRGRPVDTTAYLRGGDGEIVDDPQRDEEYTRELGRSVSESYLRDNVICSTHLLSFAIFREMVAQNRSLGLYRLLRTGGATQSLALSSVRERIDRLAAALGRLQGKGRISLSAPLVGADAAQVLAEGLKYFGTYHTHPVAERRGDRLFPTDRNLLFYYHNRLAGYGLEEV